MLKKHNNDYHYCYESLHVYMNDQLRSIRKHRLSAAPHSDLVRLWLSQYWSDRCPVLWCSASGFTQPHLTLHHSPHIRLWAWYALLGSGTLPERELVKCQLTWAPTECCPCCMEVLEVGLTMLCNLFIQFCFWDLYFEIFKLFLLLAEPWLGTDNLCSLFCLLSNSEIVTYYTKGLLFSSFIL